MPELLEIPTAVTGNHFKQQTVLDGRTYTFEFEWIERGNFWMLHLGDSNGAPLAVGIKLITDWPLLRRDLGVLSGQLVLVDMGQNPEEDAPRKDDLGGRLRLVYIASQKVD